jgi:formylglycine-generating enzyme required for sulfatase activity
MTAPREGQSASQLARRWIITLATILIVAPFAVFAWKTHRDAEVSRAGLDPRLALMVRIPAGEFSMGTDKADEKHAEEAPGHSVHLKGFWMDVTEVTNAQFTAFADATGFVTDAEKDLSARDFPNAPPEYLKGGSLLFKKVAGVNPFQCGVGNLPWWKFTAGASWRHPEGLGSDIKNRLNHPVICLTYKDAQAFAKWAGKRLPTEAEWEYAARGGLKNKAYVWGDEERPGGKVMCNHWQGKFPERDTAEDGFAGIAPVKSFPANGYGLYDMAGNVWEMCEDWYQPTYYRVSPKDAPSGPAIGHDPEGTGYGQHVIRGGSWLCDEGYCLRYRATARQGLDTLTSTNHAGFRCVRDEATPANK